MQPTVALDRFIPAPAGNSPPTRACWRSLPVHPRACGEQSTPLLDLWHAHGSSPRLRGTVENLQNVFASNRFIPAPAGNRRQAGATGSPAAVHPRACGEQFSSRPWARIDAGSSPRLRGTAAASRFAVYGVRFIPAPAGNSQPADRINSLQPVHPRACGEQA